MRVDPEIRLTIGVPNLAERAIEVGIPTDRPFFSLGR